MRYINLHLHYITLHYYFLLLLLRTFVERKIKIKYIKCAKSAFKQKCLQSGFENIQRDVR